MHTLVLSIWLILMIAVLFLAMSVIRSQKRRISKTRKYTHRKSSKTTMSFGNGDRRLWKELLTLLQSDSVTAERLLKYEQNKHPGKSKNWYLEKVIFNLKRDRN
ncbi:MULTISPECIES: hypothetical protein [unclassified Anabaena]|uniref:hypothetical protein n=1 Tax=unclassified Anabaena TaxID=2619674 RepID=UPI001445C42D|nr:MULTISPECIES: hypothetical protein [unclassified Anabaena]MTJ09241.1 hypothetical protein [Anabaena sp. UHCC 0204]MTJ52347.1 hypothetical protein [Anabaena sp. UHCC 0253]